MKGAPGLFCLILYHFGLLAGQVVDDLACDDKPGHGGDVGLSLIHILLILLGVHGLAGYAHRALALGVPDDEVNRFFAEALATIGEELSPEYLQPTLLKTGEMVCKCKVCLLYTSRCV